MYISILDYSRGTVSIINDTEDVTKDMQNENIYEMLDVLGFKERETNFMITEEDPFTQQSEYVTLCELQGKETDNA